HTRRASDLLVQRGGGTNLQHHVGAWLSLARQAKTIIQFILSHGIVYEFAFIEIARFTKCLAGTASAVTAVKRNVDFGLISSISNSLVFAARNELGDSVFKGQCDFVLSLGRHSYVLL